MVSALRWEQTWKKLIRTFSEQNSNSKRVSIPLSIPQEGRGTRRGNAIETISNLKLQFGGAIIYPASSVVLWEVFAYEINEVVNNEPFQVLNSNARGETDEIEFLQPPWRLRFRKSFRKQLLKLTAWNQRVSSAYCNSIHQSVNLRCMSPHEKCLSKNYVLQ